MSYKNDRITGIPAPLPKDYDRIFDFSGFEANNPSSPKPGAQLEAEFNAIQQAMDETQDRLALVQRDDGALKNESVGVEQLKADVQAGVNPPSTWVEFTSYTLRDTVIVGSGKWYVALESHVASDDFDQDLADGKWRLLLDLTPYTASFYEVETFTATAGQDTFAVSYDPAFVRVFKDGLRLFPDDYTATSGTEIVLDTPCTGGEEVIVEGFTAIVDSQAASAYEVTADGTADTRTLAVWMAALLQAISDISSNETAIGDNASAISDNTADIAAADTVASNAVKMRAFHGWLPGYDFGATVSDVREGVSGYVAGAGADFFTSSDGDTWSSDHTYSANVVAVSREGRYVGLANGELWSTPELETPALKHDFSPNSILCIEDNDGSIFVGLDNGDVAEFSVSSDSVVDTQSLSLPVQDIYTRDITGFVPLYAVTRNGANTAGKLWQYVSGTWTEEYDFSSENGCHAVGYSTGLILVATRSGLYRSTDGASTFTQTLKADSGVIKGVFVNSSKDLCIAVSANGVYVSVDEGKTWARVATPSSGDVLCTEDLVVDDAVVRKPVGMV